MKAEIKDFMSYIPHVIEQSEFVSQADQVMTNHDVHHLPVVNGEKLVGIVSDRDVRFSKRFDDHKALKVHEIMTDLPFCVKPDSDVKKTVCEMADMGYGSAIVMDGKEIVGIFTTTDVLKAFSYYINWGFSDSNSK